MVGAVRADAPGTQPDGTVACRAKQQRLQRVMTNHRILPEVATVLDAFEEAVEEFEAKPTVAFSSEGERRQQYFKHRREWAEQWSRPGPCMYRGCTEESIKRSHTIPLSASLKLIAEYDHVLTPTYKDFEVDLSRISAKQASTFPGFCEEHERLFSDFESIFE